MFVQKTSCKIPNQNASNAMVLVLSSTRPNAIVDHWLFSTHLNMENASVKTIQKFSLSSVRIVQDALIAEEQILNLILQLENVSI